MNYVPVEWQIIFHHARHTRFRIVCSGRRCGKTRGVGGEVADRGAREGGDYGRVAPTYNVAERGIEALRAIGGDRINVCGRAPCRVDLPVLAGSPPARVWFLSADNPDNIR